MVFDDYVVNNVITISNTAACDLFLLFRFPLVSYMAFIFKLDDQEIITVYFMTADKWKLDGRTK